MRYRVLGAFKDSGLDVELTLEAPSESAAESQANRKGILVRSVAAASILAKSPTAAPEPSIRYHVQGAFRDTGGSVEIAIDASSYAAAEDEANRRGIMVESVWPEEPQSRGHGVALPPSPQRAAPATKRRGAISASGLAGAAGAMVLLVILNLARPLSLEANAILLVVLLVGSQIVDALARR